MEQLLTISFLFFFFSGYASDYYVSSGGSDGNTGISPAAAWRTIAKVNSFAFAPGSRIFFNRGDSWHETLIPRSGSAGNRITYGAFGSGNNPLITGFTSVSAWTNIGGNLWESTSAISSLPTCNMVVINGVSTAMGRIPNTGYYNIDGAMTNVAIVSSSVNSSFMNWTGAQVVIRKVAWITDRNRITSMSGATINYTSADSYNASSGFGIFIQDHPATLDAQNEWYYNPSTKKITVYSTTSPTSIKVSTIDTLVKIGGKHYVTIDGIDFTGSNKMAFQIMADNITIQNCNIDFSGVDAVWCAHNLSPSPHFIFQNNTINHTNNNAINVREFFIGAQILNNVIKNTGVVEGMTSVISNGNGFGNGIEIRADSVICQYNEIDSSGYAGIEFFGNADIIQYNFIDYSQVTLGDGGGIYTWVGTLAGGGIGSANAYTGWKILHNIVLHAIGKREGTPFHSGLPDTALRQASNFYFDDLAAHGEIAYNTGAYGGISSLFLHNNQDLNIHDNTWFGSNRVVEFNSSEVSDPIRTITYKNNITVSATSVPRVLFNSSRANDFVYFGSPSSIDSNYWARPIDDNLTINTQIGLGSYSYFSLGMWTAAFGFDAHSHKSPIPISSSGDVVFKYNPTNSPAVISLPFNYIDVKNVSYNGTITLAPYSSAVLIKNGAITGVPPPSVNAGTDQSITTSSTTLTAVATPAAGHSITAYSWTQTSDVAITSPTSASTTITGMPIGTIRFTMTAMQDDGQTASDDVNVTVTAGNTAPIAIAGADQSITFPASTATLNGSASNDPDGTISTYLWSQVSGPSSSITSPASATTGITGLSTPGYYVYKLTVTDNLGATNSDNITVFVAAAVSNTPSQIWINKKGKYFKEVQ